MRIEDLELSELRELERILWSLLDEEGRSTTLQELYDRILKRLEEIEEKEEEEQEL